MTRRAVILDRDGVINDHQDFVNSPDDLILFPESAAAIRLLKDHGFLVCVATNQGGVGLGYLTEDTLRQIHAVMRERLAAEQAEVDDIAACVHAPRAGCSCRKPRPGMLFDLQQRWHFNLQESYMVGDRETDVDAGRAAGTKTVLIADLTSAPQTNASHVAANLLEAATWIVHDAGINVSDNGQR